MVSHLDEAVPLILVEETDRSAHVPAAAEQARAQRHGWPRIPDWDYHPSGRLRIELPRGSARGGVPARAKFADGTTGRVEDKIEDVLQEIMARAEQAHAKRLEDLRLDQSYAQEREAAVVRARDQYLAARRGEAALEQTGRWEQANRLRAFAADMRAPVMSDEQRDWVDWIDDYAQSIDPVNSIPSSPAVPEHLSEWSNLREFLTGWPTRRPWGWMVSPIA